MSRALRYAATGKGFLQKLQTPFFSQPVEFTALLTQAGFTDIEVSRYTIIGVDGSIQDHVFRWDYTARRPAPTS